jgi:hypothetical protein
VVFPSGLAFRNATGHLNNNHSRCPQCKEWCAVADGWYKSVEDVAKVLLTAGVPYQRLDEIVNALQQAYESGETSEQFQDKVQQQTPELSRSINVVPNNNTELYAFVMMLCMICNQLSSCQKQNQPPDVDTIIKQTTHNTYRLPENEADANRGQSQRQGRGKKSE